MEKVYAEAVLKAIGGIDDSLIEGAVSFRREDKSALLRRRRAWGAAISILGAAALVGVVILAGGTDIIRHDNEYSQTTQTAGVVTESAAATDAGADQVYDDTAAEDAPYESAEDDEAFYTAEAVAEEAAAESAEAETDDLDSDMDKESAEDSIVGEAVAESESVEQSAVKPRLKEPPLLQIQGEDITVQVEANSFTWATMDEDGFVSATAVDAAAPSDNAAVFTKISVEEGVSKEGLKDAAAFTFAAEPDNFSIQVSEWTKSGDSWVNTTVPRAADLNGAEALPDRDPERTWILKKGCRYEVTLIWGSENLKLFGGAGDASYIVEVE